MLLQRLIKILGFAAGIGVASFWVATAAVSLKGSDLPGGAPNLENGREMFYAGGCAACHATPGQEDRTQLGGGLALKSPFGTFYVPNISPDPQDGIGAWSEVAFTNAVVKGTSPDGQHYFPAFPYAAYEHLKLEDVRDLFAFIKTLPPVKGKVRGHDVSFPFSIRRLVGGWKFLNMDYKTFEPDPKQSAEWNRGAYLVNAAAHCAECHSPRDALGGIVRSQKFAGGPDLEGEGWVPNITQKGLGSWSEKDIAYLLQTGGTPEGDSVGGAMTAVIRNTSQLTEADRAAMAVYIKSLPPVDGPPRPEKKK
jgi:mono/diheme cytochrome c family protein